MLTEATEEVPDAKDKGGEGVGDLEGRSDLDVLDAEECPVGDSEDLGTRGGGSVG